MTTTRYVNGFAFPALGIIAPMASFRASPVGNLLTIQEVSATCLKGDAKGGVSANSDAFPGPARARRCRERVMLAIVAVCLAPF